MERSGANRVVRTTLGLLVAGPLLAVLFVVRALPATDLAGADLGWAPDALAGLLVPIAAIAALAWLVAGLRSGRLSALLMAGASAAIAGGSLTFVSDAAHVVPLAAAAMALVTSSLTERAGLAIRRSQRVRIAAAVAIVAIAEAAVLVALLPALAGDAGATHPAVAGTALTVAALGILIGIGTASGPVASAVLVGVAAMSLSRDGGLETIVGLVALIGSQVIAIVSLLDAPAPPTTVPSGSDGERLPELAARLTDAVLRFDGSLRLTDWNAAAATLLGLDEATAGTRLEDLLGISVGALPADDGSAATITGVGGLAIGLERTHGGLTAIIRDPVTSPETERLGRELRGTIEELLQARRTIELQRQEIERASSIDPLTGIANRAAIIERLAVEVAQARRYLHPVGVALIDLDGFAVLNRDHGTAGGDAALREVALRIRLRVRAADELGRIGGDSFLAVLPHTEESGAATFADALQHRLSLRSVAINDVELRLTASIGVAVMRPGEDLDPDGLLARATEALASAKRAGGNRIALDRAHGLARLQDHRPHEVPAPNAADEADR